ncbi:hypothetical protein BY996DRAFT_6431558 [Phakopsora pachyrhizi]|nr:hypothetical protein BY996DRAFT_6431558 [Phakopsora pachyrhizi]
MPDLSDLMLSLIGSDKLKSAGGDNRSAQTKGYLTKKKQKAGSGHSPDGGKVDRYDVIRQTLYEKEPEDSERKRFKALRELIPDPEIHQTIHRAFQLLKRQRREELEIRLENQYQSIDRALEDLRIKHLELYLRTIRNQKGSPFRIQNVDQEMSKTDDGIDRNRLGKLVGLFPRQIRIPTELTPQAGKVWDKDWKNPIDPFR